MSHPNDFFADLNRLRLPEQRGEGQLPSAAAKTASPKPGRIKGEFLKGPIPLPWLTAVTRLPGKAPLAVALAIWFEAGRRKSTEVKLTTPILKRFSVNRKAKYSALKALEAAGLVRVVRLPRKNPVVAILAYNPPVASDEATGTDNTAPANTGAITTTPATSRERNERWHTN